MIPVNQIAGQSPERNSRPLKARLRSKLSATVKALVCAIIVSCMFLSLTSCCSIPLFGSCSSTVPIQIQLIADDDSNNGRSVKVNLYSLANAETFNNMVPKTFFATGKEDHVKLEISALYQRQLFVRPGQMTQPEIVDVPRERLGKNSEPIFLGIIAYFSSPAHGEDRILIPLTGRSFPRVINIRVSSNSLILMQ